MPAHVRQYTTKRDATSTSAAVTPKLTHLTNTSQVHMVPISHKAPTTRKAIAACTLHFSNHTALPLIKSNSMEKGDVLAVARIAGIMAAKKCSDLIPLCHPIAISSVEIDVTPLGDVKASTSTGNDEIQSARWAGTGQGDAYAWHARVGAKEDVDFGKVEVRATVMCDGKTGVEMEALTAASVAAMTVYDMCKAVDKGMHIEGLRVIRKEGGKSGTWVEGESVIGRDG